MANGAGFCRKWIRCGCPNFAANFGPNFGLDVAVLAFAG